MLLCLTVDSQHAGVATRERFHISEQRMALLYARGRSRQITEIAGLSTCNRSEVYAWCPGAAAGRVTEAFAVIAGAWMGAQAPALLAIARQRVGADAVAHLFQVAAGLESQVLGDAQLLGQLREAYARAVSEGGSGSLLGRLFEAALHAGKRVRSETRLSSGRVSVGAEAAQMALRRFGRLEHVRAVVVGCGKTGARAARQLAELGARDVVVVNRSRERAELLARAVGGRVADFSALHGELALADVAVVATSAPMPIVRADPLVVARRHCLTTANPLLVVDLAMPRNVDAAVGSIPGVTVVDLDALRPRVNEGQRERLAAVPAAQAIVAEERQRFDAWLAAAAARDAIRPLKAALTSVCLREVAYAAGDEVARRAADRIVAKLLALPMAELRRAIDHGEPVEPLAGVLVRLFAGGAFADAGLRAEDALDEPLADRLDEPLTAAHDAHDAHATPHDVHHVHDITPPASIGAAGFPSRDAAPEAPRPATTDWSYSAEDASCSTR